MNDITKLEEKLKQSLADTKKLKEKIEVLKRLKKDQGKKLMKIFQPDDSEDKIASLKEHLKNLKELAKELNKKVEANMVNNSKLIEYKDTLNEKVSHLKKLKPKTINKMESKTEVRNEIEENNSKLKLILQKLRMTLDMHRRNNSKFKRTVLLEMIDIKSKIENIEKINKINSMKIRQLTKVEDYTSADVILNNINGSIQLKKQKFLLMKQKFRRATVIQNKQLVKGL